jgi:AcrR family transcriptional regulator
VAPERFLTIAAELRERIASGRLAPGAKVPSTRSLARRHRVALATAARALRQLAQEGLIETRPRVGAVVAAHLPVDGALSERSIVAAAIRLADDEGFDALAMRGVAGRLGAPPMSLYRHVRSKDDLVRKMIDVVIGAEALPSPPPTAWRDRVAAAVRLEWRTLRRHPWLARAVNITRPTASPATLRHADYVLAALEDAGGAVDAPTRLRLHVLLHAFVQGLGVNLEEEARAQSESGISEDAWMAAEEPAFAALASSAPAFARVLAQVDGFDMDFDVLFETGLAVLLDGIDALVARSKVGASRTRAPMSHRPAR